MTGILLEPIAMRRATSTAIVANNGLPLLYAYRIVSAQSAVTIYSLAIFADDYNDCNRRITRTVFILRREIYKTRPQSFVYIRRL